MFTKKSFVDEIANSMERQLVDGAINKQAEQQEKLVKAADYLNAAAEIFDESGMDAHAEVVTSVLESLASKKKDKNKAKDKKSKKPVKKQTKKAPSSDKMVSNLKEKGWMFDESGAHDSDCADDNCAACGDMSYADDSEQWWHLSHPESGGYSNMRGTVGEAAKHLDLKNKHIYPGWELNGPFSNINDLEKKHHSNFFSGDKSDSLHSDDQDNAEMYSMLDDFKSNSDMDFEDELDFDGFEDREGVQVHDPFENFNQIHVDEEPVKVKDPFSAFEKFYL